jgi:hypothetical protein
VNAGFNHFIKGGQRWPPVCLQKAPPIHACQTVQLDGWDSFGEPAGFPRRQLPSKPAEFSLEQFIFTSGRKS